MDKPDKVNGKYWYDLDGEDFFNHKEYQNDLEDYIHHLEAEIEQLTIFNVSKRSELLIAFFDYAKQEAGTYRLRDMNTERMVESFLKSNL